MPIAAHGLASGLHLCSGVVLSTFRIFGGLELNRDVQAEQRVLKWIGNIEIRHDKE